MSNRKSAVRRELEVRIGLVASQHPLRVFRPGLVWCLLLFISILAPRGALAATVTAVDFDTTSGGDLRFEVRFDGPIQQPRMFQTDNPARIAIDLPGVRNGLSQKSIPVKLRGVEEIQVLEAGGRTRMVFNLIAMAPYTASVQGNRLLITVQTGASRTAPAPRSIPRTFSPESVRAAGKPPYDQGVRVGSRVDNIDFRRGERGEGRVLVTLSNLQAAVNVRAQGERIVVDLPGTRLSPQVARKYDVLDFGTPVRTIEAADEGSAGSRLIITPTSQPHDYFSYQTDRLLTIEFRPKTKEEIEKARQDRALKYTGERLSLNFQDIPVRSVLQILADFTNLNIVASDSVQGNLTLRLNDVPWDQALDLVLKSKGLGRRQEGNIIRVAPTDEINRLEKEDLEARKVVEDLEPLRTEYFEIKYARAEDILKVLVGKFQATEREEERVKSLSDDAAKYHAVTSTQVQSRKPEETILSPRGSATLDARTNTLIVKDTPSSLEQVGKLLAKLDKPVRQVLIESRIVIANNEYLRQLGARLGVNRQVPGIPQSQRGFLVPTEGVLPVNATKGATFGDTLVDLAAPAAASSGGFAGFTLLKAGDYLLDLELSAAQRNRRAETLSNPRLITADQTKASIKQGVEIPYQITQAASTGGGLPVQNIAFKEAVLELNVTPHITPDDNILMDLLVKKDSVGRTLTENAPPSIDTRSIQTQAQVGNGETVVLGGIYEIDFAHAVDKVPFFGDLPGVGVFFRRDDVKDNKAELLIFVTPKLLKESIRGR